MYVNTRKLTHFSIYHRVKHRLPALVKGASLAADATPHCTCLDIVLEVNLGKQLVAAAAAASAAAAVTPEHERRHAASATHNSSVDSEPN